MMKIKFSTSVCIIFALIMGNASAFPQVDKSQTENVDVEIIEIIGKFSEPQLKNLARFAELDFYDKYNHYNDDFNIEMICRPKANIGSNIKNQRCEPVYFKREFFEQNQAAFTQPGMPNLNRLSNEARAWLAVKKKREKANAHMLALADKHPDLKLSLERYIKAKRIYEISQTIKD